MISGEEIEEILVVACADSIEFKLHTEQKFYEYPIRAPYPKKRPLYVAIYYEGVEHIAKEQGIELKDTTEIHPAKLAHIIFSKLVPEVRS